MRKIILYDYDAPELDDEGCHGCPYSSDSREPEAGQCDDHDCADGYFRVVEDEEPLDRQSHYNLRGGIEAIDFGAEHKITFCQGNALKYIYRHPYKGSGKKDLGKAIVYTKWIAEKEKVGNCPDIPLEAIETYIVSNKFTYRESMAIKHLLQGLISGAVVHLEKLLEEEYGEEG